MNQLKQNSTKFEFTITKKKVNFRSNISKNKIKKRQKRCYKRVQEAPYKPT